MIDNTAIRDEKMDPPFKHTALMITLNLNYRRKTAPRSLKERGTLLVYPPYLRGDGSWVNVGNTLIWK